LNRLVCAAIASKSTVSFTYSGTQRIVEPHSHGFAASGKELLRAYQTQGIGKSSANEGWRLFAIDNILDLQLLDQSFAEPRRGFVPLDPAMKDLHCHV
jgi:predicted DNA-binding transcriptional regulator YafY